MSLDGSQSIHGIITSPRQQMAILVRPRAWWYNKVPLSFLMLLLLVDGRQVTFALLVALLGLIGAVCSCGNYGYAINELFDRDEDRRAGRSNVAETVSRRGMWLIIAVSAMAAMVFAIAAGGRTGALLTTGELILPLLYSVPPLRIKERRWLGVCADALAAHVYPAMLALAIVSHQSLRAPTLSLGLAAAVWSLATGLRGILSHQIQSEARDLGAGLVTIVHRLGYASARSLVVFVILPIELLGFAAVLVQCDLTIFAWGVAGIFLLYEFLKFRFNVFPVKVFTMKGERYVPFVDEGAYKVWGSLALAIDAAFSDPLYLVLVPVYFLLFRPRVLQEWRQIRQTGTAVRGNIRGFAARFRA